MNKGTSIAVAVTLAIGVFGSSHSLAGPPVVSAYNPVTPSQFVECNQVDKALAFTPKGDGVAPVTDDELGVGGWRYSSSGGSFVTFAHSINVSGNGYDVDAGRSNAAGNIGVVNNYPAVLDLQQAPVSGLMIIDERRGEIVLTGDTSTDPPLFKLPGAGEGSVRINIQDPDRDGIYEGCAMSPLLKNFGFVVPEGGDFVQQEYFKAMAEVDHDGVVTFFEWTEISTFKNVTDGN